jgi:HEAT repeat protein
VITDDPRERDSVLRDLASQDDEVRRLAVERSGALAPGERVPRLVERLGDVSWRVRKAAVERLCAAAERDAVAAALVGALGDGENPGRRNAAVDALILCGASALPRLVQAAAGPDPDVRKFVVDALAGIGDRGTVPALIERLADADLNVRAAAADALGAVGGDAAVAALVATATSDAQAALVRFSALHALSALCVGIPVRDLEGALEDPVLRPAALEVLGRLPSDRAALEVLVKALDSRPRAAREAAMGSLLCALSQQDGADAEALQQRIRDAAARSRDLVVSAIERLSEADLATRLMLLQFLGLLRVREAAVPMLLAGADEALQQVALASLEAMGGVAEEAIDEVWGDLGPEARRDACAFFGRSRGARSAERLVSALEDGDPGVRTAAARALGARGVGEALAPLVHRLTRASRDEIEAEEERGAVADALIAVARSGATLLAERATALLVQALEGAAEPARVAIARVIGCIGRSADTAVVALLAKDASPQVRRAAVDALVRLDPGVSVEPLHLAIADESVEVRIAAAAALGESAREEVFADLLRLAQDPDPRVRATAVRALGQRAAGSASPERREQAARILSAACADEVPVALAAVEAAHATGEFLEPVAGLLRSSESDLVREAVRCLGAHATREALEAVIPLAAHPEWSVRAEAIGVLADRGVARALPAILRRLDLEQDEYVRSVTLRALERLEG